MKPPNPVWRRLEAMPRAFGGVAGEGLIRASADDFQVDEQLAFAPAGEGEHVYLHLRKRDTNTLWLATRIAELAGQHPGEVGYAGLKDRRALTSQWFSIGLAGRPEPDWRALESAQVEILQLSRHPRKLRIGALWGNRFRLRVRRLEADPVLLQERLQRLGEAGMPNYFGEQRFGRDYSNLAQAQALFQRRLGRVERKLRGLLISAARSQLFNEVLAARIEAGDWDRPLAGDYFMLDGSRSGFSAPLDAEIEDRCGRLDIHPSGPMWGRGRPPVSAATLELETRVLASFEVWRNGLEHVGLSQERRSLRVALPDLGWESEARDLSLTFSLPAGSYATVLLRELLQVSAPSPD